MKTKLRVPALLLFFVLGQAVAAPPHDIELNVVLQPPPTNDHFASSAVLSGTNVDVYSASNLSATREPGEPDHAGNPGGRSAWWVWTAPVSGRFAVFTDVYMGPLPPLDRALAVYTGTSVSALTEVASASGRSNVIAKATFDAVQGTVYHIAADGLDGSSGAFNLYLRLPPANDDFAGRFVIASTNVTILGTNANATSEAGEPIHAGYGNTPPTSVWWKWTAPVSGRAVVSAAVGGSSQSLAVYTGTAVSSLTAVARGSGGSSTYASFDAVAGTAYAVAMDSGSSAGGAFSLSVQYVPMPPNDNFADRMAVTNTATTNVFFVTGSNLGATKEPGEFWWGSATVWWTWTAPANGEMLLELKASGPGAMTFPWLNLYSGTSVSNLTRLVPYPEWGAGTAYLNAGRYLITAGTSYSIWVAERGGVQGSYTLRGTFWPPPANDHFTNRVTLTNTPFLFNNGYMRVNACNASATRETGEPSHCGPSCYYGGKSVWWTWTAPCSGRIQVVVDTIDYVFESMAGLYTGEAVNSLTRIATTYANGPGGDCSLTAPVIAGTTYQIAVDGGGSFGDSGAFDLRLDAYFDTNAPSVTITHPIPGFATNTALIVSGTANDILLGTGAFRYASGVTLAEVRLNGGAWQPATGTNAWSRALTLDPGANLIEARSRDAVGNESPLASVTVYCGTVISSVAMRNDTMEVSFPTEAGRTYQLEFTASLASPINWQPAHPTPVSGTGQLLTLTDPDVAGQPQRFYRLRIQP